jgi:hypothetical protein
MVQAVQGSRRHTLVLRTGNVLLATTQHHLAKQGPGPPSRYNPMKDNGEMFTLECSSTLLVLFRTTETK